MPVGFLAGVDGVLQPQERAAGNCLPTRVQQPGQCLGRRGLVEVRAVEECGELGAGLLGDRVDEGVAGDGKWA